MTSKQSCSYTIVGAAEKYSEDLRTLNPAGRGSSVLFANPHYLEGVSCMQRAG